MFRAQPVEISRVVFTAGTAWMARADRDALLLRIQIEGTVVQTPQVPFSLPTFWTLEESRP